MKQDARSVLVLHECYTRTHRVRAREIMREIGYARTHTHTHTQDNVARESDESTHWHLLLRAWG